MADRINPKLELGQNPAYFLLPIAHALLTGYPVYSSPNTPVLPTSVSPTEQGNVPVIIFFLSLEIMAGDFFWWSVIKNPPSTAGDMASILPVRELRSPHAVGATKLQALNE